ncbi:hypothetical protein GCM10008910_06650 [Faecalicatena orotica]|uniref:Carbohydrate ABC transporter substrate-binding protein (CUT1 family) n=1 Tax=Faecalicatena orotica TaxID=1544 RepID=A0A2Y9C9R9_9FIRM|nr:ABC transporter substrate-binding protein [Faecalicatena orotica]PWJ30667.1 carbohydrate ABC transporter substrate-binding protein (CUT1 family) [Faecalicatena orotica]SSA54828.1 carbohydrate ABC transporter substrate-binding protein, CUT1 family [Faecalicatena orotica]
MNKVRKKQLCSLAAASIFLLTGCSEKGSVVNYEETKEDVTSITFFGNKYEPENVTVIEEIISGFMRENPDIRVSYESLKGNDYYTALEKRMEAGKGDDVFMVNHDAVLELKAKGQLADLSDLSTIEEYTDQMVDQMMDNGEIYWMPTTVSSFGLYCNLDLLREYDLEVPENLGEWKEICEIFVKQEITPVIANNDISLKTLAIGEGFFYTYQEGRQKEVMERLNSGEDRLSDYLTSGFSVAEEFISKGYIDAGKAVDTKKTSDDLEEFVKGECPFMLTGAWAAGRVHNMEPDFDFEVVPYPVLEDGSLLVINPDVRLSVNAQSEHTEAAMRFLEYFTQEENIRKLADQQSSFSPLKGGTPSSVEEIQPLVPCYQEGRDVIGTDSLLYLPVWELTAEASMSLLSGEKLEVVMDQMDKEAELERGAL